MKKITKKLVNSFKDYLITEEKSAATLDKYIRDVTMFAAWLGSNDVNKTTVLEYKAYLCQNYKPASVNSVLSSLNSFFVYNEWYDCKVKALKIQKQIFAMSDKELTKAEYEKLLDAAKSKNNERLYLLMQTMMMMMKRKIFSQYMSQKRIEIIKEILKRTIRKSILSLQVP